MQNVVVMVAIIALFKLLTFNCLYDYDNDVGVTQLTIKMIIIISPRKMNMNNV